MMCKVSNIITHQPYKARAKLYWSAA